MKDESIAECSDSAILSTCISDNWSLIPIFGLFESGRFRQVLLYMYQEADYSTQLKAKSFGIQSAKS